MKPGAFSTAMAGIAYVEILVAIVLIVIALVPAMDALRPGVAGAAIHEDRLADHYRMTGLLETVLAEPHADLDAAAAAAGDRFTPSAYSDVVVQPDGRQLVRNVFLSRYDSDNADADNDPFTGVDAGLLWVRVEIAGTADGLETLISE
jgi:hypothetical protein